MFAERNENNFLHHHHRRHRRHRRTDSMSAIHFFVRRSYDTRKQSRGKMTPFGKGLPLSPKYRTAIGGHSYVMHFMNQKIKLFNLFRVEEYYLSM